MQSLLRSEVDGAPMKRVYALSKALEMDPMRVEKTRALTRDARRPTMGLSGRYGLLASAEWWESIATGRMPLLCVEGTIVRAYVAGQDGGDVVNTVDVRRRDGVVATAGIYTNDPADVELFVPGRSMQIVYALDELKLQPHPDGGVNASRVALEVAVELHRVGQSVLA